MRSQVQRTKKSVRTKGKSVLLVGIACQLFLLVLVSGCGNKFWDPSQVGRFRPVPSVNVILDSLGVAEETTAAWAGGEEPRPADTVFMETDYVFESGDIIRVNIFELMMERVSSFNDYVVTETGKISIPDVGIVQVSGLTETQLEEEIKQILSPSILKDPSVTVSLMMSQKRVYSILGDGIPAPGRYPIPRYDYRLFDAIAAAGGQRQFNVSFIYVSRQVTDMGGSLGQFGGNLGIEILRPAPGIHDFAPAGGTDAEMLEIIAPRVQGTRQRRSAVVIASTELATVSEYGVRRRSTRYASSGNLGGLLGGNTDASDYSGGTTVGTLFQPAVNGGAVTAIVNEVEQPAAEQIPTAASLWEEPEEKERVSINDLLKTLAAESQSKSTAPPTASRSATRTAPARTRVTAIGLPRPAGEVVLRDEPVMQVGGQPDSLDAIMRSIADRPRAAVAGDSPARTGSIGLIEPGFEIGLGQPDQGDDVDSILRSLEARSVRQEAPAQAEWQNVLESFAEPEMVEPEADEEMDLDELLKSFAEPGVEAVEPDIAAPGMGVPDIGVGIDEQIELLDVDLGIDDIDMPVDILEPGIGLEELGMSLSPGGVQSSAVGGIELPGRIEWVFQNGKWVPMQVGGPAVARPVIRMEPEQGPIDFATEAPVGGMDWGIGAKTRLIKIPTDRLMAGDPRYNIVIKPGDSIYVPVDVIGEFCIMGNVVRQGYIPLTGRALTLKMAVAAAGGLGPLAYPKNCEVTRRIGKKKEETVMVNLDKIASGEQPDFFIKPNDLINVGTHSTSRWRAVLRNAFRASYGLGFVYDRNFALDNYYNSYGRTSRVDLGKAVQIF